MQIAKNRIAAIAIAIILTFSMSASMMLIPSASAHSPPWNIPTYAYITAAPAPVGVGQPIFITMWLTNVFSPAELLSNDYRFHNFELYITAPNGTTTETTFPEANIDSIANEHFTPTSVGTWVLNFTFPGQPFNQYAHDTSYPGLFGGTFPELLVNDTYLPSSASFDLTVQQAPVTFASTTPLPTSYWTRPIYGLNSNWYTVSSNWLGEGAPVESCVGSGDIAAYGGPFLFSGSVLNRYPGDAVGSLTSHIMWTKPLQQGGIVGGDNFQIAGDSYFEGSAYEQRYDNPIIMDGILYYQAPLGYDYPASLVTETGTGQGDGTYAVNLQTGQQIWESNAIPAGALSFGYIYDAQGPNQKGVEQPILFTTDFAQAYDAWTGDYLFNMTNLPAAPEYTVSPQTMGPNGETLEYAISNGYLAEWNSSNMWNFEYTHGGGGPAPNVSNFAVTAFGVTTQYTDTINGGATSNTALNANPLGMFDWNISLPSNAAAQFTPSTTVIAAMYGNMIIGENGPTPNVELSGLLDTFSITPYTYFAINLNSTRGAVGSLLWTNTVQPPPGNETVLYGPLDPTTGVFTEAWQQTMQWVGYSMTTGAKIWGPTPSQTAYDYYGNPITPYVVGQCAYGNLYSMGYGGILYCYDDQTGKLLWTYGNGGAGNSTRNNNTPFGDNPSFIQAVGNDVIYIVSSEHTVSTPIYKGQEALAVNATTGAQIWTLSDYTGEFASMSYAMADGYNTWLNGYDNQIYVVGQGPSDTTVTAPQTSITEGTNVIIQGTVMDISAGTQQTEQAADFPNGVPCASDASMSAWMSYVYQQQPEPTNFTGVTVTLTAIDPNHNSVTLGTATTDENGMYHLTWTAPSVPGTYSVTATFAGTNGYYGSTAETNMYVGTAPPTPAPTTPPVTGLASTASLELGIAVIAVIIIIIGVVLAMLLLRKRP